VSRVVAALLAELTEDDLAQLALRLAPYLPDRTPDRDVWLNTTDAAEYLGLSRHGLHRLTADRAIPVSQDGPGARCYYRRSDLDRYRCSYTS